jgi:hypothetical protein
MPRRGIRSVTHNQPGIPCPIGTILASLSISGLKHADVMHLRCIDYHYGYFLQSGCP